MEVIFGHAESDRQFFYLLRLAAEAHARWEIETSTEILRTRKKLLILWLLPPPPCGFLWGTYNFAAGNLIPRGGSRPMRPPFSSFISTYIGVLCRFDHRLHRRRRRLRRSPPPRRAPASKVFWAVGTDLFHILSQGHHGDRGP